MKRVATFAVLSALVAVATVFTSSPVAAQAYGAQPKVRPSIRGRSYRVKVDSSPQQAAVFWDAGTAPKDYGVAGYSPITVKVPRGIVKFVVELRGFKTQEKEVDVRKNQTLMFTLERAALPGRLDLRAGGDGSAAGAEAFIDGVSRGTMPNLFEVSAGRHQLEVKKAGFRPMSDWIEIGEDERRTRDITLERAEAPGGALLVTSDGGGDVYVDGVRKDVAPAMITGIPAGEHVVEVRKDGQPPWRQSVVIVAGQQVKVTANLASTAGSTLRVICNESDVTVFIDGEDKGRAPATVKDIRPGQHIVEGRKPKFKSVDQTVRVVAGEVAVVELKMEPGQDRARSSLKVQSTVANAEVFVDGSSLGRAPIERTDLEPGKHYITVHRDGYTDFKREVVLIENQPVALVADLSATGAVRVISAPEGADVRIDGELVGKSPLFREAVAAGDHVLEFRLKGYFDHKETIKVEGGREKLFSVDLKQLPTGPSPEQQARRKQGMSSFGARVNPVGGFTADLGLGYPYYMSLRMTVGAASVKPLGLDAGVELRTFFQMLDVNLHGRLQLVEVGPLAVAVRADMGAGFGRNGRNTIFGDASGIAALAFSDVATFFLSARFSWWTDRFCPSQTERNNGTEADDFCGDPANSIPANTTLFGGKDPNNKWFGGSRVYAGLGATAALDRQVSLYFQVEFLPFPAAFGYDPRLAFTDKINSAMVDKDTFVYGSAGLSLKF